MLIFSCRQCSVSWSIFETQHIPTPLIAQLSQYVPIQLRSMSFWSFADLLLIASQFFYRHELLKPYKYYWRYLYRYILSTHADRPSQSGVRGSLMKLAACTYVSVPRPDVKFFCDLDYDPFLIMQDQQKVYGT